MRDEQLDEIEARAKAATDGPWDTQAWGDWFPGQEDENLARSVSRGDDENILVGGPRAIWDAAFIAAARTDVPELVAEVRRLRPLLVELLTHLEHSYLPTAGLIARVRGAVADA